MNDQQLEAIQSEKPNTVVLAGPGSGKTAVLVERVNRLLETGADPEGIVVVTYTNAAAGELVARLYAGPQEAAARRIKFIGTLHAWILRILMTPAGRKLTRLAMTPSVMSEAQADALLDAVKANLGYKGTKVAVGDAFKAYPERGQPPTPAELVVAAYKDRMRETCLFDFRTILDLGKEIMSKGDGEEVKVTHLFVDEIQDAAADDWHIYGICPASTKFFVGDPDQAIFGWRGGKVELLLEYIQANGVLPIVLTQNYRSDHNICDAANNLIAHNAKRASKKTLSSSLVKGDVKVHVFASRPTEYAFVPTVLKDMAGTRALLLRTNAQVENWVQLLAQMNIGTAQRMARTMPADWVTARNLLSVFANPTNDMTMVQYLEGKGTDTREIAQKRLRAAKAGRTLAVEYNMALSNGHFTPHYAAQMLKANQLSDDSVAIIRAVAELLPARATMGDLLVAVSSDETGREFVGDLQGVKVLTLHSAKGLEFDNVVIAECDEPLAKETHPNEEERRLYFVGITRARHNVLLTASTNGANRAGKPEAKRPLCFLREIEVPG